MCGYCCGGTPVEKRGQGHAGCSVDCYNVPRRPPRRKVPASEIERVLRENGLTDRPDQFDSSIHSWRCEHPDRYGSCTCFADLVAELAALS